MTTKKAKQIPRTGTNWSVTENQLGELWTAINNLSQKMYEAEDALRRIKLLAHDFTSPRA